ncbi:hypothetical protein AK812_SmicGene30577 [Symbiodinium microadriaticum]|uniref:Uncharacterized protein n=1 Tax=Symbiodinium microadriaticum TaxID=2951 RepID=A0A1Q9CYW3_SYMMI|nr:hypothetical protein AK812_SmicGene30577 [Symbiodinium microadriaticum]
MEGISKRLANDCVVALVEYSERLGDDSCAQCEPYGYFDVDSSRRFLGGLRSQTLIARHDNLFDVTEAQFFK